jgi:hypothetical protein
MPRYATLEEIDRAGFDVRLWCFRCGRGHTVDGIIYLHFEKRGLSGDLRAVQPFFPCRGCGGRDALILPCTPATPRHVPSPAGLVAGWFHQMRSAGKKQRR